MSLRADRRPTLCYRCGGIMRKTDSSPETYRCECGYAVKRLEKEESRLSLLAFREIETQ